MSNSPDHGGNPAREKRLLQALRNHPELLERFEAILALTDSSTGAVRSADEIEERLIEEVRRLGHRAMQEWAHGAEERAAADLRQVLPKARLRKKNA
jgi:hypothetical protein